MKLIKSTNEKIDNYIQIILKVGVYISLTIILIGLLDYLIGVKIHLNNININSGKIVMVGILVLILTPYLRVITSIISFLKERDYRYITVTVIVLLILTIGFLIGAR